jgi:hypothetical protein
MHISNPATRPALFNILCNVDMLDETGPAVSWDVMDQFPPENSRDKDGGLVIKRLCGEPMSPSQEGGLEAGPSNAPQYVSVICQMILKTLLD